MIKKITFIFLFSCISAQVQYDPKTGEPVEQKKFDPNTGEQIEQKFDPKTGKPLEKNKEGITAKITLTTGDIIQGILVSQDQEKIIVESKLIGKVILYRNNIKSMSLGGIPTSSRRSVDTPTIKTDDFSSASINSQSLEMRAKNEAKIHNQALFNYVVGAGACFNPVPYITLPVMGLGILTNAGVPEPKNQYYIDLNPAQKKKYKTIYEKETRKLRGQQCFTPTFVLGTGFALMIGALIFGY